MLVFSQNTDAQTPSLKFPIAISTVSSLDRDAVIYDENPIFAEFALSSIPKPTIQLSIPSEPHFDAPGAMNPVTMSVTKSIEAKDFLFLLDEAYAFCGVCE